MNERLYCREKKWWAEYKIISHGPSEEQQIVSYGERTKCVHTPRVGNEHSHTWLSLSQGRKATLCFYSHGQRRLTLLGGWNCRAKYSLENKCITSVGKPFLRQWSICRCTLSKCVHFWVYFCWKTSLPGMLLFLILGISLGIICQ